MLNSFLLGMAKSAVCIWFIICTSFVLQVVFIDFFFLHRKPISFNVEKGEEKGALFKHFSVSSLLT